LVELALVEVTNAVEIEAEAVEGAHAEGGVFTQVIGVFDPAGEVLDPLSLDVLEGKFIGGEVIEVSLEGEKLTFAKEDSVEE
jgi:hypothetical protein